MKEFVVSFIRNTEGFNSYSFILPIFKDFWETCILAILKVLKEALRNFRPFIITCSHFTCLSGKYILTMIIFMSINLFNGFFSVLYVTPLDKGLGSAALIDDYKSKI